VRQEDLKVKVSLGYKTLSKKTKYRNRNKQKLEVHPPKEIKLLK
jgi:hypothetical protein